jgi:hypothetical protein
MCLVSSIAGLEEHCIGVQAQLVLIDALRALVLVERQLIVRI